MGRRGGGRRGGGSYKKVTTVGKDIFGRKVVETRYVKQGTGCGAIILIFVLFMVIMRGC